MTTTKLPAGAVGVAYNATLSASGGDGTYVWTLANGSLPAGLELGPGGAIAGIPVTPGNFGFTVQVASASSSATLRFTLDIAAPLQITFPTPLPRGVVGKPYHAALTVTGGDASNQWSLAAGALPAGLTLSAAGVIAGTPTTIDTAEFELRVANALGQATTAAATFVVVMPLAITTAALPRGAVGHAYDAALAATGGGGTQQWSVHSGSLPAGLALSASGVVRGTPTAAGVSVFRVAVVDGFGLADTTELSLEVVPAGALRLKVAFIGDQGSGPEAVSVLQLIRDEGADMVLHGGDFDYEDNPTEWDQTITSVLGPNFPYFASVGNHDDSDFYGAGGYQEKLQQRLARVTGATCTGDLGVNSSCRYRGLFFILSGAGTLGTGHESYLRQELAADNSIWRICSWHKNQNAMQVGGKSDEVGWGPYEACRELGAIIATGHEHSYSRTRTLVNTQLQTVDPAWPAADAVRVTPGATFVFVSGLGGRSIREQERCLPTTFPYGCKGEWASIYTSDQGANYGALFIDFNVDGNPNRARGYFKNIDGAIVDQFTITAQPGSR